MTCAREKISLAIGEVLMLTGKGGDEYNPDADGGRRIVRRWR
jgi:hypothetical protein